MSNLPSVPSIPATIDPQLWPVLNAIKQHIDAAQTDIPVTQATMATAITNALAGVTTEVTTSLNTVDTAAPSAIGDLTVTSGILYNYLGWGTLPGNLDHVEVWRSATNDRTVAALIGTSLFTVYADYLPDGVDTLYYYWIRAISKAGVAGSWNAVASAGTAASPQGIADSQVSSISANKIFALTLSALTANLGDVTAGTLKSPDAMFMIDLINKFIIVGNGTANPGSVSPWYGSEYVDVRSGSLTTYQWNGSSYSSSKSLRVIETGVATNGTAVSLTKYYSSQPKIIVSPANLQVYSGANSTQNQTLLLTANSVTGSGSAWTFTPTATLQLAAGVSGTTVVNNTVSNAADVAINSAQQVTVANSTSIVCSVSLNSDKGTGTAPNWYYRQVSVRIRYGTVSGTYTGASAATVVAMGADHLANVATISVTGLTAGTYYFVVEYTPANVTGNTTWSDGGAAYTYATNTVQLAANSALVDTGYITADTATILPVKPTMPSFTPVSGYSVYSVAYTVSYGYYLYVYKSTCQAQVLNAAGTMLQQLSYPYPDATSVSSGTVNGPAATNSATFSTASYSPTATLLQAYAVGYTFNGAYSKSQVKIFAAGTQAVISSRMVNTNTATIANSFILNNYYSNISGTAPLATGTLNWMAIL